MIVNFDKRFPSKRYMMAICMKIQLLHREGDSICHYVYGNTILYPPLWPIYNKLP